MARWTYARQKAMTQATTTYTSITTGLDGSEAGVINVPPAATVITKIKAVFGTDGGHLTNTGIVYVLSVKPQGQAEAELVLGAEHMDDGGGTLTYTIDAYSPPVVIDGLSIPVTPGSTVALSGAYYGTDTGNQYVYIEVGFD